MKSVVIIPARYSSTRFPGKPLVNIFNKPMIIWVAEIAEKAVGKNNVYIATESEEIRASVNKYNFNVIITSKDHITGTDRVAEAAQNIDADIFINLQGDEPLVNPIDINLVIQKKKSNLDFIVNGFCYLNNEENPLNVNLPKVVTNEKNYLLYMSRSSIPGSKSENLPKSLFKKQVCIYGFSKKELNEYLNFGRKSHLEEKEDIEILRFFELNKTILMVEVSSSSLAVDIPEDVSKVEEKLRQRANDIKRI